MDYDIFGVLIKENNFQDHELYGRLASEWVKAALGDNLKCIIEKDEVNDNNIVELLLDKINENNNSLIVVVLYADTPLVTRKTISEAINLLIKNKLDVLKMTRGYVFKASFLSSGLKINSKSYYFDEEDFIIANNGKQISLVQEIMHTRINDYHIGQGVNILDPNNTYIDCGVNIGKGTIIEPMTIILGNACIGENVLITAGSRIDNSVVEDFVKIFNSQLVYSFVGKNTSVGPYAYIRPNSRIGENCKIGNCVEIKQSVINNNSKIPHFTYVGDAYIGENCNIGCGTIFANYNGKEKREIIVGNNVFVGSNANLIAPLNIEDGAYIAAGSTITDDVPSNALAIARNRQLIKKNWNEKGVKFGNNKISTTNIEDKQGLVQNFSIENKNNIQNKYFFKTSEDIDNKNENKLKNSKNEQKQYRLYSGRFSEKKYLQDRQKTIYDKITKRPKVKVVFGGEEHEEEWEEPRITHVKFLEKQNKDNIEKNNELNESIIEDNKVISNNSNQIETISEDKINQNYVSNFEIIQNEFIQSIDKNADDKIIQNEQYESTENLQSINKNEDNKIIEKNENIENIQSNNINKVDEKKIDSINDKKTKKVFDKKLYKKEQLDEFNKIKDKTILIYGPNKKEYKEKSDYMYNESQKNPYLKNGIIVGSRVSKKHVGEVLDELQDKINTTNENLVNPGVIINADYIEGLKAKEKINSNVLNRIQSKKNKIKDAIPEKKQKNNDTNLGNKNFIQNEENTFMTDTNSDPILDNSNNAIVDEKIINEMLEEYKEIINEIESEDEE